MSLPKDGADIESHELHQANLTHGALYDLPHVRIRRRGSNILGEFTHIGPADCSFHRGDDSFEWLSRNDAPSLDVDRTHSHTFDLKVIYAANNVLLCGSANQVRAKTRLLSPRGSWNDGPSSQLSL